LSANSHLRGSASGLLYQAVSIIVALLLTPVILSTLGGELYGVWALLNDVLTACEGVSDLGIPAAIVVFVNRSQRNKVGSAGVAGSVPDRCTAIKSRCRCPDGRPGPLTFLGGVGLRFRPVYDSLPAGRVRLACA